MNNSNEILKMIETVDPADTAKLDEIDARVWCLTHDQEYAFNEKIREHSFINGYGGMTPTKTRKARKYTRSRDALKAIRPEGWDICVNQEWELTRWSCRMSNEIESVGGLILPTEELAELHAIIQAIDYERTKEE